MIEMILYIKVLTIAEAVKYRCMVYAMRVARTQLRLAILL